eukprot:1159682-Pelagomonas_calceolata.AAC.8
MPARMPARWGWTPDLHLVVVEDTGRAALYTLHGRKARELSLGAAVEAQSTWTVYAKDVHCPCKLQLRSMCMHLAQVCVRSLDQACAFLRSMECTSLGQFYLHGCLYKVVWHGVAAVAVQPHALAVLTKQHAVWVVGGLDEGVEAPARPPVRVADPPLPETPALGRIQMVLLEPQFSMQHTPEVWSTALTYSGVSLLGLCW